MGKKFVGFPNIVRNNPIWRDVLLKVFNYNAPFYDLEKYNEAIPGAGVKFWNIIQKEMKQKEERERGFILGNPASEGF